MCLYDAHLAVVDYRLKFSLHLGTFNMSGVSERIIKWNPFIAIGLELPETTFAHATADRG